MPVAPIQFVEPTPAMAPVSPAPVSPAPLSQAPVSSVPVSPAIVSPAIVSPAAMSPAMVPPARPLTYASPVPAAVAATTRPAPLYANGSTPPARPAARPAVSTSRTVVTSPTRPTAKPAESSAPRPRRPVAETARLADEIEAMNPKISEAELAEQLGVSKERLKAIRREAQANPVGAAQ
jgi:hypothetical protein